jgi:hypothetical protein
MNIQQERTFKSLITLSNLVEVATRVITEIAGNDISNAINGNLLTTGAFKALIISETRVHLNELGVK